MKQIRIAIRLEPNLYRHLKELAKTRHVTVSDFCREHLERAVFSAEPDKGLEPITKSDLEGLLTKADLVKLHTFFTTVIATNKITVTAMKPNQKLMDDALADASKLTDEMLGEPRTKPNPEAKS